MKSKQRFYAIASDINPKQIQIVDRFATKGVGFSKESLKKFNAEQAKLQAYFNQEPVDRELTAEYNYIPWSHEFIDKVERDNNRVDMMNLFSDVMRSTQSMIEDNIRQDYISKGDLDGLKQYDQTTREINEEVERSYSHVQRKAENK